MARKKKEVQQIVWHDVADAIGPVPPVAVLIDGENVIVPDLIAHILAEAGKLGGVKVRHVYGNWAAPSMQPWKKYLAHYGLEPLGNRSGPNATDIALVIGAMDLLYRGIKHFCLVAGDSDYVPLVLRLRQSDCTVLVIGVASTASNALKEASSIFLCTEQLVPQETLPVVIARSLAPGGTELPEISTLLTQAYHLAMQKSETEWITLSKLGLALRELHPDFEVTYGKKSLSEQLKQYDTSFETRTQTVGKGQVGEVRLRRCDQENP